ncbi:beta and beta-prime subunits of DNA dependent RNA-polymerase, partial [Aureobasidium melanogenum]
MNISQPVSSQIGGVEFAFLPSDEIRALSVKRITNPTTFDTLLNPVPGGLYDAALGNFGDNSCTTCNLKFGCPGHCGHIELPVHVYNPTFMDQCLRLLRAKCIYCHKLKMSRAEVNRFVCKLTLVKYGLLKECYDVDEITLSTSDSKAKPSKDDSDDEQDEDTKGIIARRNAFVKNALKQAGFSKKRNDWADTKIEAVANERRAIVKEFLYSITKSKKCSNCNGISPTYRKDRFVKIFRKPLSEKDRIAMVQAGFKAQDPLLLMKKKREAQAKKQGLAQDEAVADLEDSPAESEGEGEDISMLDIEQEVAGGNALESETATTSSKSDKEEKQSYLNAGQVHAHLVQLFEQDAEVLGMIYTPRSKGRRGAPLSAEMFFIKDLIVPPNRFRPEARTGADEIAEAQENSLYKNIINVCDQMTQIHKELNGTIQNEYARRPRNYADFQDAWIRLQDGVNSLLDRDRNPVQGGAGKRNEDGIKQRLEKKEGLFRKNMMGKRVNFAARTVISPDPNIETNEIGVPPVFALKLTYPEPVNDHNYNDLRQAVINGPYVWPGAVAIENENGQVINLQIKNAEERTALANQLQAPSSTNVSGVKTKKVHRHLNNGDIVIMNRQPTLHKPSMMCHRARVLPGEKTLRMHYANCNTYNADFDGDEMNLHFPQNELARSEAISIADNDHQYLSGTAGKPLRGLIQDHISMGVWLTNRDTFFGREDYHQLLYAGLRPENNHTTSGRVETVPPAIRKPRPLWTGKQVVSSVLKNLTPEDFPGLTMTSKSSTAAKQWGTNSEEQVVIFKDGELLCGILDKAQIGPSGGGVVNAIYETYGHTIAGKLMSVLGRLLTKMLHMRAFSCGVEDLIFTPEGENMRREALSKSHAAGLGVAAKYVSLQSENPDTNDPELRRRLEAVLREDAKQAGLDTVMNQTTAKVSGDVTSTCLPAGLVKPFPKNQMQAMTGSGAKGSGVNANQISCNLGQQVLEGRRVPVMVSGKTLPCFKPFETSVRAGGYIVDRFLTGVRPQEYYFHAMAGREGLIDTAVKTSRSGYLQRCLIKGMEGLKSEYDTTVRDADGSIIQFIYGEDGLDVGKAKYLSDFKFIAENHMSMFHNLGIKSEFGRIMSNEAAEYNKAAEKKYRKTGDLGASDPALSIYSAARFAGSTSEKLMRDAKKYIDENPDRLIKDKKRNIEGVSGLSKKSLQAIIDVRYLKSIVEPGEAVGVVAGQSVGEPSTQMTLNTFHLAGHAAKNVTLGIPRLREIVMTASATIATPTMTLHVNPEIPKEESEQFAKGISRLSLAEVLDKVTVTEKIGKGVAYEQAKSYTVRLQLFPSDEYTKEYAITVEDVARTIETKFLPRLQAVVRKELKKKGDQKTLKKSDAMPEIGESAGTIEQESGRPEGEREGGDDDSDDEGDDDATRDKAKSNKTQGGYDAPDEDEAEIVARGRRETTPEDQEDEGFVGSPNTSDDSDSEMEDSGASIKKVAYNSKEREERIKSSKYTNDVSAFKFDDKTGASCTFTIEYAAETAKILMLNLVENCARDALIQSIPGLAGCMLTQDKYKDPSTGKEIDVDVIMTEGENLAAMRLHQGVLNPNRFFTNDIAAMLRLYGVEACRASIVREVSAVFGGHGISVDQRHLNLIADYMTRGGGYQAFSRQGIKGNTSPFMKMSFETTVGFLRDAVMEEDFDDLSGPSARIVVGKIGRIGTGGFDVMMPVLQVSNPSHEDAEENGDVMAVDQSSESEEDSDDE